VFAFLHAADLHLDSPLRGLDRYEGAPADRIRAATREAFDNLVKLAVAEKVSFVLLAGDLYDGDWKDYNTALYLASRMSRLREAGIRVVLISGNHDAASQITRSLDLPDNVTRLSTRRPETVRLDEIGVVVHGQGFPNRAVLEDISEKYPQAESGLYNIGLLHTCATGRDGHEAYAPCKVERLAAKGYDYWALGHVHKREVLREDPWIVFPGNVQGRHVKESGPKGCTLVTVEDGRTASVEHRDLHALQWAHCPVDATGMASPEAVVDGARKAIEAELAKADGRLLATRVTVTGAGPAHTALAANPEKWTAAIRAEATDLGGGAVWVEKVRFRTKAALDLDEMLKGGTPLGDLLRFIQEYGEADGLLAAVQDDLAQLKGKLPSEFFEEDDPLSLSDPGRRREILEDVKQLLIPRLLSAGEGGK
jgi:DNA repair protein SbcD/Mre11